MPLTGERSLASMLGGGDLDGYDSPIPSSVTSETHGYDLPSDLYSIIKYAPLLPTEHAQPADYEPVGTRELPNGQESTVDDICDFIVEYINSDVLVRRSLLLDDAL